jgi:DNA-directed RNA polymerase subunit H (RpoH/RPB5)
MLYNNNIRMNNIIENINRSRYTLKEILRDEWDVSHIPDVSSKEIDVMYRTPSSKSNNLSSLGVASACNLSIPHKYIPSNRLHIVYYNFPEIGRLNSKITKSACDKISNLYKTDIINKEDSIFVIINDPITDSLKKKFNELNIELQSELSDLTLSDEIIQEMNDNNYLLQLKHFRNVQLFTINSLTNNLLNHSLVPKHIPIRKQEDIQNVLDKCNCTLQQLPIISKDDIICQLLRIIPGDICEIKRKSTKCGEYSFFRLCQ